MVGLTYEEKYFMNKPSFLIRAYILVKKRINGLLIYLRFQIVSKSSIVRAASPREVMDCFQLLKPRNYVGPVQRIGGDSDGGYVVPILDYSGVISPGTGNQVDFENHFARQGLKVVCIDGSVSRPQNLFPKAVFLKKFLSESVNDESRVTLNSIVETFFPLSSNLLLQCDIEGAEWKTLAACDNELLSKFIVISLELHYLDHLLDKEFMESSFLKVIVKLQEKFVIINNHPNNAGEDFFVGFRRYPEILELTLINKDFFVGNHNIQNSLRDYNKPNVRYKKVRTYHFLK